MLSQVLSRVQFMSTLPSMGSKRTLCGDWGNNSVDSKGLDIHWQQN